MIANEHLSHLKQLDACIMAPPYQLYSLTTTFLSLPIAPDSPPSDISSPIDSPYHLSIVWAEPARPNGVITQYTVYIDYRNNSGIVQVTFNSVIHSFNLTGLSPYQTVLVAMSASTRVGEGVRSGYIAYTTQETGECHPGHVYSMLSN